MLNSLKLAVPTTTILLLCALPSTLAGQESRSNPPGALNLPDSALAVCPARSINYITDTLPQQCLSTGGIETIRFAPLKVEDASVSAKEVQATASDEENVGVLPKSVVQVPFALPSASGSDVVAEITNLATRSTSADSGSPTTEVSIQTQTAVGIGLDGDGDSPLDNANFLSFEEWKKQNLAKVGQSLDNIAGRKEIGDRSSRGRPATINNALDSLGEDTEIEIDFGGFVNPGSTAQVAPPAEAGASINDSKTKVAPAGAKPGRNLSGSHMRSKDAGKTCKERFNYASFDCAATVLKTNKECKGSTSVLVENKDSYMLNKCSADNKFFIVELCDNILVDTVVLANFEFFSSMFRTFRVSVSDQYPVKLEKWRELGLYEARNSREVQAFPIESPLIWARYLRIEFLAHYGSEYYCPVSLLRVHGTTMMEEFNHDMKGLRGEEEADGADGEGAEEAAEVGSDSGVIMADTLKEEPTSLVTPTEGSIVPETPQPNDTLLSSNYSDASNASKMIYLPTEFTFFEPLLEKQLKSIMQSLTDDNAICVPEDWKLESSSASPGEGSSRSGRSPELNHPPSRSGQTEMYVHDDPQSRQIVATAVESVASAGALDFIHIREVTSSAKSATPTSSPGVRPHTSTQPPAANPTTQESFFKTVHKRLQLLEANSTLSLQYIEDQSRILRDAFTKVEKRQLHKMTTFLESLNTTLLNEVRHLQTQYDQLWQSTVLELSAQRELSRREVGALSARLSLLADEMLFQKRIAILQSMLILLCLSLVIFARFPFSSSSSPRPSNPHDGSYVEFPSLLPSARNKSSASLARYAHLETPTTSPSSTRPSSRYGIFGRGQEIFRSPSEESGKGEGDGIRTATAASHGGAKGTGSPNGTAEGT